MIVKKCCTCKIEKDILLFGLCKTSKDGHHWRCKDCKKISDKRYSSTLSGKITRRRATKKYFNSDHGHTIILNARRKDKRKLKEKEYRIVNKEKIQKKVKERYNSNPLTKLSYRLRIRTREVFKRKSFRKTTKFADYIGCNPIELKQHIESQFKEGMNWSNHGIDGWHLDHIIPLASARTPEELYKLCHFTNIQPLWAKENLSKGDSY